MVQAVSVCQPLATVGEGKGRLGRHLVHSRSKLGFLLGAAGANIDDGNQLREAPRLGARPGPSPAPADPAKGETRAP